MFRRLGASGCAAAAIVALAWQTGGWWAQDASARNLTVARVTLFVLLTLGLAVGVPALGRTGRLARGVFAGWAAYLGLWLLGTWPGLLMSDSADSIANAQAGAIRDWFSWVHGLLHLMVLDLVPQAAALAVVQVLATAGLLAYVTVLLHRRGAGVVVLVGTTLLLALSAPVIVNTLLLSRDTLYALGHVLLALLVADAVAVRRAISRERLLGVAALTGVLLVYRGDGIALALAVPLALLLLRPGRSVALRGAAVFAASFALFVVLMPALLVTQAEEERYGLVLRLNPLGQVLQQEQISAADTASLGRVIDVAAAKRKSTPLETPVFWEGNWNFEATRADFDAMFATTDRLLVEHLGTVAVGRAKTLSGASGLRDGGFRGSPPDSAVRRFEWIANRDAIAGFPPVLRLYSVETALLQAAEEIDWLTWNFLPALALLVVVLLRFRRLPFAALFAALILVRVPLLFVAAPAAQFKYYYAVYLAGIIVLGLVLTHVAQRRRSPGASPRGRAVPVKLLRFAGASGAGQALDIAIYAALCELGVRAGLANLLSAACGVTFVFFVSAHRDFEGEGRFLPRLFLAYAAYQAGAILLASLAVDGLTTTLGGAYLGAKLAVLPVTFAANFLFTSWLLGPRRARGVAAHG